MVHLTKAQIPSSINAGKTPFSSKETLSRTRFTQIVPPADGQIGRGRVEEQIEERRDISHNNKYINYTEDA